MPGVSMSMMSSEMPLCFGSGRIGAHVAEALLRDHRVRRPHLLPVHDEVIVVHLGARLQPARSEPAFGSLIPMHQIVSPRIAAGASAFCASLPNSSRLGATIA